MRGVLILIFVTVLQLNQAQAQAQNEARMWTNAKGQSMEAKYLNKRGSTTADLEVQLQLANGSVVWYAVAGLSQFDKSYVAEQVAVDEEVLALQLHEAKYAVALNKQMQVNANRIWPSQVNMNASDGNIELVKKDEHGMLHYETDHYRFISDIELAGTAMSNFCRMFEATHAYAEEIPFFYDMHLEEDEKTTIYVFNRSYDYLKYGGGVVGSAGYYYFEGDKEFIVVCFDYLGVKRTGDKVKFDYQGNSSTIPHEIVHSLTDRAYYHNDMKWFTEGIAEYMSNTPYANNGSYRTSAADIKRVLVPYITGYGYQNSGGLNLGEQIRIPSLWAYMTQPNFFSSNDSYTTKINYMLGYLVMYYLINQDGKGKGERLKAFTKAVRVRDVEAPIQPLIKQYILDGRTPEQLDLDFATAMKELGITIRYN